MASRRAMRLRASCLTRLPRKRLTSSAVVKLLMSSRSSAARTTRLKWRLTLEGSSDQQSLGVLLGNHQKFEGCLTRPAGALLPASNGVRAYVQVGSEKSLAGLQRLADVPNLFR